MIVKIRTHDIGWEYFECPKGIKTRILTKEQAKWVWSNKDTHYIIRQLDIPIEDTKLRLIRIYENITIYTDDTVYLLNNEGKTIEKLN